MGFEIEVAKNSSFCPGVERAYRITLDVLEKHDAPVFSAGPIIHNRGVVSELEKRGLTIVNPDSPPEEIKGHPLIIRSHGIDLETERKLEEHGALLVDATCSTVKRAQKAAKELVESGYPVLLLGSAKHPEIRSIAGRAGGPVTIIESPEDAMRWREAHADKTAKVGIVCQTTISSELLDKVKSIIAPAAKELRVKNTICESVLVRRRETLELAKKVDLMIVVGGKNSSNTARLVELCRSTGVDTYHIEEPSEISESWFGSAKRVGVTGGASTPKSQILKTVDRLREIPN
ncbi:MAG: 4-hydroxy-3-methylbut-2-enyl diphosphate reductase [Actinomycetota bacterium]|nr:4-hydroxy-3-methylbut-2-enyl diphosphate reductase [Actinomycetota bacterium]